MTDADLLREIDAERNMMVTVATGGPRIETVNDEYKQRRDRISNELSARGLQYPNSFSDLWSWYGKWSSGDLPTYQSRRQYLTDLYALLIESIKRKTTGTFVSVEPTGWARVDRNIDAVGKRLETANSEEEFQTVGLLCREALISLAQAVFDPSKHPPVDGVTPSETDAARMLEAVMVVELQGGTNEVARRHAKASLSLANELQHRRTAEFRDAALCAEATRSVVNLMAIVSGRRDQPVDDVLKVLVASGELPFLSPDPRPMWRGNAIEGPETIQITVRNVGKSPAINAHVYTNPRENSGVKVSTGQFSVSPKEIGTISPNEPRQITFRRAQPVQPNSLHVIQISYGTLAGHEVADEFTLLFRIDGVTLNYAGKRLVGASSVALGGERLEPLRQGEAPL